MNTFEEISKYNHDAGLTTCLITYKRNEDGTIQQMGYPQRLNDWVAAALIDSLDDEDGEWVQTHSSIEEGTNRTSYTYECARLNLRLCFS